MRPATRVVMVAAWLVLAFTPGWMDVGTVPSARAAGRAQAPGWETFRSDAGGFQVQMPSQPIRNEQSVVTDYGAILQQQFIAESPEAVCIVAYLDFPKNTIATKGADRILDDACQGALQGMGVNETSPRRAIALNGNPGRAIEAAAKDGSLKISGRFFLAGTRGFTLLYATSPDAPVAGAAKFFESFVLL